MRRFITSIIICFYLSILLIAQESYFHLYPDLTGVNYFDAETKDGCIYVLSSRLIIDKENTNGGLLRINTKDGNLMEIIDFEELKGMQSIRLYLDRNDNTFYVLNYYLDNNSDDSLIVAALSYPDWNQSKTSIAFPSKIVASTWCVERDSILILSYVQPSSEKTRYIKVAKQGLVHDGSLKLGPKMTASLDLQQRRGCQDQYVARNFGRVYNWDITKDEATVILFDTIISHGHIIPAIHDDGYALFGLGQVINSGIGYQFTIVVIDSILNFQKRVLFGEGSTSFDYAALTRSIDHDTKHYFVAGHINISLFPYASTVPKSFYVGKFDEELNESWLHILGGDKHYFISGVKADGYGGCYVYGFTRPPEYNFEAIPFLMRLNADGLITSSEHTYPDQYHITIYGNPGRDAFRFGFMSGTEGYRIRLIDLQGRIVADTEVTGGTQEVHMTGQSSGVYIWQLYHPSGQLLDSGKWMKVE